MKAMILAAGRGERMRPLTDHTPKPLLKADGKPLIEHTIINLVEAGFSEIIVNLAHLGQQIKDYLGNGHQLGACIEYSDEANQPLETAGGIANALPLIGDQVFLVVNGDIATDFPFATLKNKCTELAHLVLIQNPSHHQQGDFALAGNGYLNQSDQNRLTFSGIGIYHPDLFKQSPGQEQNKLGPLLRLAIDQQKVTGEQYNGFWMDIGTPQRLLELEIYYQQRGKQHARTYL